VPFGNLFSKRIPFVWQRVLVWGGLRGALSLALALSRDSRFPYRDQILNLTFGVVVLSILVQGRSIKPLLRELRLAPGGTS
jgi:CPA1 family monovalent cation:H+ antiporter